jgi:hypothetical protein
MRLAVSLKVLQMSLALGSKPATRTVFFFGVQSRGTEVWHKSQRRHSAIDLQTFTLSSRLLLIAISRQDIAASSGLAIIGAGASPFIASNIVASEIVVSMAHLLSRFSQDTTNRPALKPGYVRSEAFSGRE